MLFIFILFRQEPLFFFLSFVSASSLLLLLLSLDLVSGILSGTDMIPSLFRRRKCKMKIKMKKTRNREHFRSA